MGSARKHNREYIRQKRRTRIVILVLVLMFFFIGALVARAMISMPYESVDLCSLARINIGGYNTAGTAEAVINDEAVDALLSKVKKQHDGAGLGSSKPEGDLYIQFRQSLGFTLDKTEGLSNGSVLQLNCTYDKELADELKIEVTKIQTEVNISGLPTVSVIRRERLFDDLEVSFSGVSPNLVISMKNNSDHPFIGHIGFEILNPKEFYSDGDEVIVRANFNEDLTEQTHFVVDSPVQDCVKCYFAEANSEYVSSSSDLPSYIVDEAINAGKGAFTNANEYGVRIFCEANLVPVYVNKVATFQYGMPQFVSAYFKTVFPQKAGELGLNYNDLDIIYSVVITQADGVSCTAYAAVRFSNIIKNDDGSYSYDFSNPTILSESFYSARVKKNVTDSYYSTHDVEKIR